MSTLPTELLRLIVSQVTLSYVHYPNAENHKRDISTLKSIRLANWELSQLASVYLFEELTLYFTEASHAKMMAIAQHLTYSSYVRSLRIAPKAIPGPLSDRDAFVEWFNQTRPRLTERGYDIVSLLVSQRTTRVLENDAGSIDFHYAEYKSLYKKQEQLSDKAGNLLKTAIGCFKRLEEVGFTMDIPRMEYSVPSADAAISELLQDCACRYGYDFDQSVLILRAAFHGRSFAGAPIDISKVLYNMDTMVIDLSNPVTSEPIQRLVTNAKEFNFYIQTWDFSGLQQLFNAGKCQTFLGSIRTLELLRCSTFKLQGSPRLYPTVWDVLGENTWQHLHCLELSGFCTSARKLSKLLNRHRSTLRKLLLQHILLTRGYWVQVFFTLQGSAVRDVKIYHVSRGVDLESFLENMKELPFDQIPSSPWLHDFLFRRTLLT